MPGQHLAQANPAPDPSLIPDSMLLYTVKLNTKDYLPKNELNALQMFRRAGNYVAAGGLLPLKIIFDPT